MALFLYFGKGRCRLSPASIVRPFSLHWRLVLIAAAAPLAGVNPLRPSVICYFSCGTFSYTNQLHSLVCIRRVPGNEPKQGPCFQSTRVADPCLTWISLSSPTQWTHQLRRQTDRQVRIDLFGSLILPCFQSSLPFFFASLPLLLTAAVQGLKGFRGTRQKCGKGFLCVEQNGENWPEVSQFFLVVHCTSFILFSLSHYLAYCFMQTLPLIRRF